MEIIIQKFQKILVNLVNKKNNNIEIEGIGGNNYSEISKNFSEFGDEIYNGIKEKFEKIKSKFIFFCLLVLNF